MGTKSVNVYPEDSAFKAQMAILNAVARGTYTRPGLKVGRNDLCPCGSEKKYKKCCQRERAVKFILVSMPGEDPLCALPKGTRVGDASYKIVVFNSRNVAQRYMIQGQLEAAIAGLGVTRWNGFKSAMSDDDTGEQLFMETGSSVELAQQFDTTFAKLDQSK